MPSLFRFSLRALLIGVTIAAVGLAALLNANGWWEAAAWTAALLALACALLLILYRHEEQRAFWAGFAVFGGMYLALVLYATSLGDQTESSSNPLRFDSLATTKVTALAYRHVIPESKRQEQVAVAATKRYELAKTWYSYTGFATSAQEQPATADIEQLYSLTFTPDGGTVLISGNKTAPNPSYVPIDKFLSIGHVLWLLIVAAAGGKICQAIYRTRPQQVSQSSPHSEP